MATARKTKPENAAKSREIGGPDLRRLLPKLHRIVRDSEGNSSILERFDEISKLLFLKLFSEQSERFADLFRYPFQQSEVWIDELRATYAEIAAEHPELFPAKFRTLNLTDRALSEAAASLNSVELKEVSKEIKGFAYEEMIRNTFDKGDNQQFFTPTEVVGFMVQICQPFRHGRICDPACGTGGFLAHVAVADPKLELLGLEIDERLAWIAGLNLLLHGAERFSSKVLNEGGTLGQCAAPYLGTCDLILTNPPFGSDFAGPELETYSLGKGRGTRRRGILFIERSLQLLKPGGVLAIIIDEGVLSGQSTEDVRALILRQAEILAVFSLPDSAFLPYASVSTSILLLRKSRSGHRNVSTFYAKAENIGRKANGEPDWIYEESGSRRLNTDLAGIQIQWALFASGESPQGDGVYLAKITETAGKVPRLDYAYQHPARRRAESALLAAKYPLAKLSDLVRVRNETVVPAEDLPDQMILYTGLAHIEAFTGQARQVLTPTNSLASSVRKYYPGDILYARMRPNLRKVAMADAAESGYASAECMVLEPRADRPFIPRVLAILLRSDFGYGQIVHHIAGIGRPRITSADVLNIQVPLLPIEEQMELLCRFEREEKRARDLLADSVRIAQQAEQHRRAAVDQVSEQFLRSGA